MTAQHGHDEVDEGTARQLDPRHVHVDGEVVTDDAPLGPQPRLEEGLVEDELAD